MFGASSEQKQGMAKTGSDLRTKEGPKILREIQRNAPNFGSREKNKFRSQQDFESKLLLVSIFYFGILYVYFQNLIYLNLLYFNRFSTYKIEDLKSNTRCKNRKRKHEIYF